MENTTLSAVNVTDEQTAPSSNGNLTSISCPSTTLAPGATVDCTASYTVTQADLDNGSVADVATAHGTPPSTPSNPTPAPIDSPPSDLSIPTVTTSSITLTKTANPTTATVAGTPVSYSFTVTNTGTTTLSDVTVAETAFSGTGTLGNISCTPANGSITLAPGATATCTAAYALTQADVNAGQVTNTAVASGTPPIGNPIDSAPANAVVTITPAPSLTVLKSTLTSEITTVGQQLVYSFLVTNEGNVTLSSLNVTDVQTAPSLDGDMGPITCNDTSLAPGASTSCTATYTVTQADLDNGGVTDTATAHGTPPGTTTPVDSNQSPVTVPAVTTASLAIVKSVNPTTVSAPGTPVTYSFLVTNTGTSTLHDVTVNDTAFSGSGTLGPITCTPANGTITLAPNASITCTASYSVTQADIDAGTVTNTATATGTPPTGAPVTSGPSSAVVTASHAPGISVQKDTATTTITAVGQQVPYTFTVTNNGNVTLNNINVTDEQTAPSLDSDMSAIDCPSVGNTQPTLAPGASTICTATYTVTQADLDNGGVTDTAVAHGTPEGSSTPIDSPPSVKTVPAQTTASLTIEKFVDPRIAHLAGDQVAYTFFVQNTGTVTLTNVTVNDTHFSGSGALGPISCTPANGSISLAPGASIDCTADYALTQADVDAGTLTNTATASGNPPTGPTVTSPPSGTEVTIPPGPALSVQKTSMTQFIDQVGQTVVYSFLVKNNGNVTLNNINVTDVQTAPSLGSDMSVIDCPQTTLAPGASTSCTATYTVTQVDLDNGGVTDTATAHGTPPGMTTPIDSIPDTHNIPSETTPALTIAKSVSPATVTAAGTPVTYTFEVKNTGTSTLTDVTVNDVAFSGTGTLGPITCTPTNGSITLTPGATIDCTASYTVTQADIDAGQVTNTATASGNPPTGPTVTSPPSDATVDATQNPSISVTKASSTTLITAVGQQVPYTFTVTNDGNVTLDPVTVTDAQTAPSLDNNLSSISCGAASLAPGASTTCTASYTVTQADLDHGSVADVATAHGTPPETPSNPNPTPIDSPPSGLTIPASTTSSISLTKVASPTTVSAAGDPVSYTFRATNTGTTTLTNVTISETAFTGSGTLGTIDCTPTNGSITLAPAAGVDCTASYTVTQTDIDAGSVTNTAIASGTPPTGSPIESGPATAVVTATPTASLTIDKSSLTAAIDHVGQLVTYSFLVTNTGTSTLNNINVTDVQQSPSLNGNLSAIVCNDTSLAPGASTTCTASYTATQADLDNGSVTDTATAHGTPSGSTTPIDSPNDSLTIPTTTSASLTIAKSANPTTVSVAGTPVTYSFLVTNTGTSTLSNLTVNDTAFSGTGTPLTIACTPANGTITLAPNATITCTATYVVTQADIDAGTVTNTATATGTPPTGAPVTSPPSTAVVTASQAPGISVVKDSSTTAITTVGQKVPYTFTVTNNGNTTLNDITVTDEQTAPSLNTDITAIDCPQTTLAPGASTICTASYTVTQADLDNGGVTDTAIAHGTPEGSTTPIDSPPSDKTIPAQITSALTIDKSVTPGTVTNAGTPVTYTFHVTNTGTVTLQDVTVNETAFSGTGTPLAIDCTPDNGTITLAPGASIDCTATYSLTQADVDAGSVTNTATASGTPPTGAPVTSPPSSAEVTSTPAPQLTVAKSSLTTLIDQVGQQVHYSFLVTNEGNVTLSSVNVTDVQTAPSLNSGLTAIDCPSTSLAPGASTTCTATYTVTQADLDNGGVADVATAHGTPPGTATPIDSNQSPLMIPSQTTPALTIAKTVDPGTVTAAGQTVSYTFEVKNTGTSTLSNVTVNETAFSGTGTLGPITCTPANGSITLAPGASVDCTATYAVTQADVDAGQVTNTATATGNPPSGPIVTSPPSSATVTATQTPAISIDKASTTTVIDTAGQQVPYTFTVTNNGNVTLNDVNVTDEQTAPSLNSDLTAIDCLTTTLAPTQSAVCTATYTVTQADLDNGGVTDTAVAHGAPQGSQTPIDSPKDMLTIPASTTSALAIVKSVTPDTASKAGDQVVYSFDVTNTGTTTLTNVTVNDTDFSGSAALGPITCTPANGTITLAPGASIDCTADYTLTQDDVDAGQVTNTATASGNPPTGPTVTSPPSDAQVTITPSPSLTVVKSSTTQFIDHVGQSVDYSFLVTNTGNVTLSNVDVTDEQTAPSLDSDMGPITCNDTSLAPGASTSCSSSYTVTQADLDNGSVTDTATAHGTPPGSTTPVDSPPSDKTIDAQTTPALEIVKKATPSTVATAGTPVTYTFTATNTGTVTLHDVTVNDTAFSGAGAPLTVDCTPANGSITLAPNASIDCSATYAVTQADIDAGTVTNTATATGTPPTGAPVTSPPSTATVTASQTPGISVVKDSSTTAITSVGQQVPYTFTVTNNGNVTLNSITVTDEQTAPSLDSGMTAIDCPATTLAPGASTICTASYTVTQADLDNGGVTDTATAHGTPEGSTTPIDSPPSDKTIPAQTTSALTIAKSVDPGTARNAGDQVSYTFHVQNTGTVTLTNVTVNDTDFSGSAALGPITCPEPIPGANGAITLAPGASVDCTADYTLTQTDVDAGTVTNTATASGNPPTGPTVTSPPSNTEVTIPPAPALTVKKTSTTQFIDHVGQSVVYSFLVTNTGTVTLNNIDVTDAQTAPSLDGDLSTVTCDATTLAPNATTSCEASYTVTQADLDNGSVADTATAHGTPPGTTTPVDSPPSSVTIPAQTTSSLTIDKSVSPETAAMAGTPVTYTFVVTNTGTVTLHDVTVDEGSFTGNGTLGAVSCTPANGTITLAPGATATCTADYTVTQADIDQGTVTNTATATGTPPTGPSVTSPPDTATITTNPTSSLTVLKTSLTQTIDTVGQQVTYGFLVTNTGQSTLHDIDVTDEQLAPSLDTGLSSISCDATTLAPGASTSCEATYTVTQADLDNGSVTDTATAHGTPPGTTTPIDSPPSTLPIPVDQDPGITVDKTVSPAVVAAAGTQVTYTFHAENTGNVTLSNVTIVDQSFTGSGTLAPITCTPANGSITLAPGATIDCTATYTLTQADIDAGSVDNSAIAQGTPPTVPGQPTPTPIDSPPSTSEVTSPANPSISIVKTADPGVIDAIGQQVGYTFTVTNTGNVTLSDVNVTDVFTMGGGGTMTDIGCGAGTPGSITLAPGAVANCTATYTANGADFIAGSIENTATATGNPPKGDQVTDNDGATVTATPVPGITVEKTASPASVTAAGNEISYSFHVTNTGNVPLTDVTVNETAFSGSGTLGPITCGAEADGSVSLAVGASVDCTASYTTTQADIDSGALTNTATATGTPPGQTPPVTSPPSTVTVPVTQSPSLTIMKSADPSTVAAAGDTVTYHFLVTNTGNVTLNDIAVNEGDFTGSGTIGTIDCAGTANGSVTLAPGASVDCAAPYAVTQDDIDQGTIDNTATAQGTPPATPGNPNPEPVDSPPSSTTVTVTQGAAITVVKTTSTAAVTSIGQKIPFQFLVTNTGNVTLTDVTITDALVAPADAANLGPITCGGAANGTMTLAPGASVSCDATYTVSKADYDGPTTSDVATATATPPSGPPPVSPQSSVTVPVTPAPHLTVVKSANPMSGVKAGDTVTYSFLVTNDGNVALKDVGVDEAAFSGTGSLGPITCGTPAVPNGSVTLAAGASVTCAAGYVVTATDAAHGQLSNVAAASGTSVCPVPSSENPATDVRTLSVNQRDASADPACEPTKVTSTPSAVTVKTTTTPTPTPIPGSGALADTGSDTLPMLLAALALLLLGAAVALVARSRRRFQ